VEQLNKLLMHFGCRTALGTKLQTSLGLLLVELGMSFQPLQLLHDNFGNMVTTSWLKRVWEKLARFKFAVTVHNLRSVFPQEGDNWLMTRLIAIGYRGNDLWTLNRVRKHQQVLFLSDILGAGGESLDKCYLQKQRGTERWSTMKFPRNVVTEVEMHLWHRQLHRWLQLDQCAIGLGHSMRKDIRYGTGGFERMLVDYSGAMGTPLRLCNMFNKDYTVHLGRVGLGK
jgi:hypothetical protein